MTTPRNDLFREQALAHSAAPEQLDDLIRVTRPMGWAALLAAGGLLVLALVWSVTGSLSTTTPAQGLVLSRRGLASVFSPVSGDVRELYVAAGDTVATGAPVAEVAGTTVTSLSSGRVIQVLTDRGSVVTAGAGILTLEPLDATLGVVAYVPLAQAKQLQPGMTVQVTPSTVRSQAEGFMRGRVSSVAELPSTATSMRQVLGNDELVKLFAPASAPVQVWIDLDRDARTPSGYAWSSAGGPALALSQGTLCQVTILVRQERPITRILPFLEYVLR